MIEQLILNGIITGSIYFLVAIGFALIYQTTRFFHFAHGAVYTFGAYASTDFTPTKVGAQRMLCLSVLHTAWVSFYRMFIIDGLLANSYTKVYICIQKYINKSKVKRKRLKKQSQLLAHIFISSNVDREIITCQKIKSGYKSISAS
jgi:hypothetical protein